MLTHPYVSYDDSLVAESINYDHNHSNHSRHYSKYSSVLHGFIVLLLLIISFVFGYAGIITLLPSKIHCNVSSSALYVSSTTSSFSLATCNGTFYKSAALSLVDQSIYTPPVCYLEINQCDIITNINNSSTKIMGQFMPGVFVCRQENTKDVTCSETDTTRIVYPSSSHIVAGILTLLVPVMIIFLLFVVHCTAEPSS